MIVFGGAVGQNDVWELDLSGTPEWNQLAPAGTLPSGRIDHAAIHDLPRGRMVFFGGFDGMRRNDVWALDLSGGTAWSELTPTGSPPSARSDHVAIYDRPNDRMIVFGGLHSSGYSNDVWELSFAGVPHWTQLFPSGTPPVSRGGHAAIWDPIRRRMIVFGGVGGGSYRNDVWALSLTGDPHWTELVPSGGPPQGRYAPTAIYDPARDRMIVHGGMYRVTFDPIALGDVWALSLSGSPTWTELAPSGTPAGGRWNHSAVFDPVEDRMLVFAGEDDAAILHDTWALTWGTSLAGAEERSLVRARLGPPRPNPSRSGVRFDYELPSPGPARVEVYDAAGRSVGRIADGLLAAGRHLGAWSGTNDRGERLPAGLYFIRLETAGWHETRRAVLLW
jgi:hypothetical protein